jgi:hypothetical protein
MAETTSRADRIAAAVRELATADVVAFGGVGIAGQVLPGTEAQPGSPWSATGPSSPPSADA